jgi:hypothetical protein
VRLSCLISPSLILHKNAGADSRFNLFQSQEAAFPVTVTPDDDPEPFRQPLQVSRLAHSVYYTTT